MLQKYFMFAKKRNVSSQVLKSFMVDLVSFSFLLLCIMIFFLDLNFNFRLQMVKYKVH